MDRNKLPLRLLRVIHVALLAEGVDRNSLTDRHKTVGGCVALLAEGVDRNHLNTLASTFVGWVALLAEGVDRNTVSSWRVVTPDNVALLAEGVDRNRPNTNGQANARRSPSSRRAWIEIFLGGKWGGW